MTIFEKFQSSILPLFSFEFKISIRMKTTEELKNAQEKNAQEETIEYYKLNSDRIKSDLTNIAEL